MIKCKVQKGGTIQVKAKGTVSDVSKEFLTIASEIYHGIKRENEPAAEEFSKDADSSDSFLSPPPSTPKAPFSNNSHLPSGFEKHLKAPNLTGLPDGDCGYAVDKFKTSSQGIH